MHCIFTGVMICHLSRISARTSFISLLVKLSVSTNLPNVYAIRNFLNNGVRICMASFGTIIIVGPSISRGILYIRRRSRLRTFRARYPVSLSLNLRIFSSESWYELSECLKCTVSDCFLSCVMCSFSTVSLLIVLYTATFHSQTKNRPSPILGEGRFFNHASFETCARLSDAL